MSVFRKFWKSKAPKEKVESKPQITSGSPQGPLTPYFQDFHLRKVSGEFYEMLREGIPIIDAAINRLISLNGTIKIIGDKMPLVKELEDFNLNVPVGDMQKGMQAFLQNFSNETFEQGFSLSEFIATKDMKDIAGLKVADSKQIVFRKNLEGRAEPWYRYPGTTAQRVYSMPGTVIQQILTASYGQTININGMNEEKLNLANKLYFSINNENSNPYGTSIMRSMEFVSQILVTLQNSIKSVYERFGDPSYHIHVKTVGKNGDDLEARRSKTQTDFNTMLTAKRQGKSADLVTAGGADSEVNIKVVGSDGKIVTFNEIPLKHLLQQMIAKLNLPAWMIGIYWSTTERMATTEVELCLQDARVRQLAMLPELIRLYKILLTLRGYKWNTFTTDPDKPGDWGIMFETPNIRDIMAIAQARFLNAEADLMESGAVPEIRSSGQATAKIGSLTVPLIGTKVQKHGVIKECGCTGKCTHTKESRPDPWPELDRVEERYESELKFDWNELQEKTFDILGLHESGKSVKQDIPDIESFTFSEDQREAIMKALGGFEGYYDYRDSNSAVRWAYGESYSLGLIQAAQLIGKEKPILDIIKNREIYDELCKTGFKLVKNNATTAIKDEILPAMQSYVEKGYNPRDVARKLGKLFEKANSDWERLARTELSMAAERAKVDEWTEWKVEMVEFVPAPDGCPICQALKGVYPINKAPIAGADTHPRCRCSLRPAASEA